MILPGNSTLTLILLILGLLCWGSWSNTFKMSRAGWRFELYYFDFAIGFFAAALIAAFTFGSLGFDGFTFMDDLQHAGKKQILFGFCSGLVFNLGNMLLAGALSVLGMSTVFPVAIGLAIVSGALATFLLSQPGNPPFLFAGAAVILVAAGIIAMAYRAYAETTLREQIKAGIVKSTKVKISMKGVALCIGSGIALGLCFPLLQMAQVAEIGLGPYAITFVFALGILVSTFVYNLFFINLPVQGEPAEVLDYFRAKVSTHLLGAAGGILRALGMLFFLVAGAAEGAARVASSLTFGLGQGAVLVSVAWGVLVWKEYSGGDVRVKSFLTTTSVLFLIGIVLVALGQPPAR